MAAVDTVAAVERTRSVAERALTARLERAKLERTRFDEARTERIDAERVQNERLDELAADERLRAARDTAGQVPSEGSDDALRDSLLLASEDQSSFADQLALLARAEGLRVYRVEADQLQAAAPQDQLALVSGYF